MDKIIEKIKIRQFKEEDLGAVTSIMLHSFESKFHSLMNLSDEMMIELLKESGFVESNSFEGYLVAEGDNKILGVMSLKWKGQKRIQSFNKLRFMKLGNKYGFRNIVKFVLASLVMNENISDDECYVESIAVSPESRGLGVGTMLINYGKKIAENKPTLNRYSLHVAVSNVSAVRLYKNLGFNEKNAKIAI